MKEASCIRACPTVGFDPLHLLQLTVLRFRLPRPLLALLLLGLGLTLLHQTPPPKKKSPADAFPEPLAFGLLGFSWIRSGRSSPLLPFFRRDAVHESVDESSEVSSEVDEDDHLN